MGFCYVRGHKDTQRTSKLWHKRKEYVKWAIEVCSRETSVETAVLALGRFFSVLQQEKAVCPLKVKKEFSQNLWKLVISSLKWYLNEIRKAGLWVKNKVCDISSYEHVRKEKSMYFFAWTENLKYPSRALSLAEQVRPRSWEGSEQALWRGTYRTRVCLLRVAGKGTGHRNPAKQGSFVEGKGGGGRESWQIPDTRIDLRKENQPEKFKTEQLYFLVGSREPSALLLRVILSLKADLRDHSATAFVDGSRRGDSQGHQLGHQEWLPTSTVEQSQGLFVRYNDLMCSSVSSSAKWG